MDETIVSVEFNPKLLIEALKDLPEATTGETLFLEILPSLECRRFPIQGIMRVEGPECESFHVQSVKVLLSEDI
jgi:hypothetical protein